MRNTFLLFLSLFLFVCSRAAVRLPAVIASGMVLQQRAETKLWGWSEPGERIYITTSWDHRLDSVRGSRDGKWELSLHTPSAGGPYAIEINASNRIVLENVLIGEVWVCSGQSNMEMNFNWGHLPDVQEELGSCGNVNIRLFNVPRTTAVFPQDDCNAQWVACDSNTLKSFSAVGYFFGKRLNNQLNVPIGLIEAAWGGTPAEVWTPAELVNKDTSLRNAAEKQVPKDGWPYLPGYCYNAMIAPLTSFTVAGALWYQGEGNTVAPFTYEKLLTTMIGSWRKAWNKPLSFYYVQIAPYTYGIKDQGSVLREQEANVQRLEGTGMVVISDVTGDTADIHPKNKHDVGLRLANWALAETYHRKDIIYKSPAYRAMEVQGDKLVLDFFDAGDGLVVKGPAIRELWIAGEDRVFYPGKGEVKGTKMIVTAKEVRKPVAVRYQFSNAGVGNVFSKQGLPLAPFRTDKWGISLQ